MEGLKYPTRGASKHGRDATTKKHLESGLAEPPQVLKETADDIVGCTKEQQRPMEKRRNVNSL